VVEHQRVAKAEREWAKGDSMLIEAEEAAVHFPASEADRREFDVQTHIIFQMVVRNRL
jgi:hypothetical protein